MGEGLGGADMEGGVGVSLPGEKDSSEFLEPNLIREGGCGLWVDTTFPWRAEASSVAPVSQDAPSGDPLLMSPLPPAVPRCKGSTGARQTAYLEPRYVRAWGQVEAADSARVGTDPGPSTDDVDADTGSQEPAGGCDNVVVLEGFQGSGPVPTAGLSSPQ